MDKKIIDELMLRTKAIEQDYNEKIEALQKNIQEQVKPIFEEILKAFPEVKAFQWTQYTPYFNDGEECVFGVNSDCRVLFDGFEEFMNEYDSEVKKNKAIIETISSFIDNIPTDAMKGIFGDHVKVTVSLVDGNIKIDTEEYDHD